MSNQLTLLKHYQSFGGTLSFYSHWSERCACTMNFSIFLPPQAAVQKLPVLYFLAGLTCTEENFMAKAGAQRAAAEYGLALVAPDTSPRNVGIPGEDDDWDFGTGAGFYVDATVPPWSHHYRMYSYITEELPTLIAAYFPITPDRQGISGHSMGGHGALVCGLRHSDRYRSISAFAPIAAPSQCPWGQKAFSHYLGENRADWSAYDATELVLTLPNDARPILIDQGLADSFLEGQLYPEKFVEACRQVNRDLTYRAQPQYDHSYYFIATFIEDHIRFHARHLNP
ncbi:MAG: S-formylglutathione hydrolase [Thermosynechococcaceae cyanobacterium MS004]|nr:S-formylglutathione hydrolase [Thermosynechococcaceae cyanobacterium MS004]